MKIEVIRPSASRPDLLEKTHFEFLKRAKWNGEFHFILHEDVLDKELSAKCIEFALSQGYTVQISNPPVGQGEAVKGLWKECKEDYIFQFEDDWLFVRDFDLDSAIYLMDKYKQINQICYHKRPTMDRKGNFIKEQIDFDGQPLVLGPHWHFLPGIWRRSFVEGKWKTYAKGPNFGWEFNANLKQIDSTVPNFRDSEWMKKNIGAYFWGRHGEPTFVKHLGLTSRRLGQ